MGGVGIFKIHLRWIKQKELKYISQLFVVGFVEVTTNRWNEITEDKKMEKLNERECGVFWKWKCRRDVHGFVLPENQWEKESESVCDVRETRRRKELGVRLNRGGHQAHVRKLKSASGPNLPLLFYEFTFRGVLKLDWIWIQTYIIVNLSYMFRVQGLDWWEDFIFTVTLT